MTSDGRTEVLVLGLGNVLCGDDGAGVCAVHRLQRDYALPAGVVAADGGTLGLGLLAMIADAERVILVDAVAADAPPGTLVRLDGDDVGPAVYERLSPHQIGVADVLAGAALIDRYPTRVVLIGVVPETLDLGLARTPAVDARIPDLIDRVVAELTALGFAPSARETGRDSPRSRDHVARTLGL